VSNLYNPFTDSGKLYLNCLLTFYPEPYFWLALVIFLGFREASIPGHFMVRGVL